MNSMTISAGAAKGEMNVSIISMGQVVFNKDFPIVEVERKAARLRIEYLGTGKVYKFQDPIYY